jgi:peptide deformylase
MQVETGTKNKILREVSKPVKQITAELRNFALDMIKTMDAENGVGIAAPQVGRNIRMVICRLNPGEKNELVIPMVNPVLLSMSDKQEEGDEGCLSLPKVWGKVKRAKTVLLRFQNLKGKDQTLELEDFNARIIQHEIDHLDGVLFIDKATGVHEGEADEEGPHI